MNLALTSGAYFFFALSALSVWVLYLYLSLNKKRSEIEKEKEEASRRLYELSILKELGDRTGYSLNVEEILEIITGSLGQFIKYSVVSYIVISPDKIKINMHIEDAVNRDFLQKMESRMLASLFALTNKDIDSQSIERTVSGAILSPKGFGEIGSFFNIPLVVGGNVAGILTIANRQVGLYKEADMTILYKITSSASEAVSRLQEVIRTEQGKLNSMVLSMGEGVLMVDYDYRVIVANPAIKRIIKFEGGSVTIFDFVDALGGKFDIHGRLKEVVTKKQPYRSERINIDDNFFEIGVYPVFHSKNNVDQILGAVVVFNDVTRDITIERLREEFTSMIVHELRSPLDGIKKIIELVVSGGIKGDSSEFKDYMKIAHQSSSSMLELVNDILDLSKLQAGKFEVKKEKSNIKDLIENRILFYKVSADTRGVSLNVNYGDGLEVEMSFDPQALKQIMNNFISNALKFTSKGGSILISVFVFDGNSGFPINIDKSKFQSFPAADDIKVKNKSLSVVVSDTGIGIKESDLKDLFHTYKQAKFSPIVKDEKGTGLGLVIAKGIVEAHKGTIGAVSRDGAGSSFFFTIPL